jgi:ribosomal protein L17
MKVQVHLVLCVIPVVTAKSKLEQLTVSNLVQKLLAVSKIETTSFEPTVAQELLAVSNLAQELIAVSKIETTSFEPNSGTITSYQFRKWKEIVFSNWNN